LIFLDEIRIKVGEQRKSRQATAPIFEIQRVYTIMIFFVYSIIFVFGLLIGNFATTIFYRIPKEIVVYGFNKKHTRPPHCSFCGHELTFAEYLPLLSLFATFLKCNYCKHPIPYTYTIIEFTSAISAVICYYYYNQNMDLFLIIFCTIVSLILTAALWLNHKRLFPLVTLSIVSEGILFRTLNDQTITYWLINLFFAGLASILLLQNDDYFKSTKRQGAVQILVALSVWL
jgi:prepilin signal peptidase PulO-like enzyme (type II secretory pathway)